MLLTGIAVGILAYFSIGLTFTNLSKRIQRFCFRHHLFTEIVAGIVLWTPVSFISHTLVALIALFVAELLIWATLKWGEELVLSIGEK